MPHWRKRFIIILALVLFPISMGTAGYIVIEGFPFLDALYMAVMTVTTVGYGEVHPLSSVGRTFNIFVMLTGVTALLLAVGAMTQTIIEIELTQYFSKRRTRRMIESLRDHVIICGFGRVGRNAADELKRAGEPFIILDRNEDRVDRAMRAGMLAALGDATLDANLREVGIDRAKGMIAALASDADNLFLVLSAKTLNTKLKISARVNEEEAEHKMRRAGADAVLAPYNITGTRLAQAIIQPHVVQFLDFTTNLELGDVSIEQVRVGEHSGYASKSLGQLHIGREMGVIVLAIRRSDGEMLFNPNADTLIDTGDYLIAMGPSRQLRSLEAKLMPT